MTSIPHFHPKTENTTIYQATAASCGVLNPSWNKLKMDNTVVKKLGLAPSEILVNLKVKYLEDCLKNLVMIQTSLDTKKLTKKGDNIHEVIKNKIADRLNNKELAGTLDFLAEKIEQQEKCFSHGDYHPGNILVKYNKCIPIDFEYAGYTPMLYDALFLIENPDLDLSKDTKNSLIKFYLKEKGISLTESLRKDIDYMALFINLRWAGISSKWENLSDNKSYNKRKLKSLKSSEMIINHMSNYAPNDERMRLQNLKECLKGCYQ